MSSNMPLLRRAVSTAMQTYSIEGGPMSEKLNGRFSGKVMIVTGGARGIGAATASRAAEEGAKVVLVDRLKKEGEETLAQITSLGGDAIFLHLDLSEEEASKEMVARTIEHFDRLDIAINNAGVMGIPNKCHEMPAEDMDYVMKNNYYSVFFSCKYELQHFIVQGRGVIVNTASVAGLVGFPGTPAYVSSKHAVNGLTKNLACDYTKLGIRVNSVNPDQTDTPMVDAAKLYVMSKIQEAIAAGMDPAMASAMVSQKTESLFKREAKAYEQAAPILYLASDDASHISGATFQTDGGWTSY